MSVLVVGVSHRTAPVSVLERVALDEDGAVKLLHRAVEAPHVTESVVISTCNRVEVYVEADRFHGSVEDVSGLLVEHAGLAPDDVLRHLYVHYDDAAVAHLFSVAAGLDSMVVGESQVLGQVRSALQRGQDQGTAGASLNVLFQQALRIGKRGHSETGIDQAGPSIVSAALERGIACGLDLAAAHVLVIGAGAMAALSATTCARRGVQDVVVVNRTPAHADRLAAAVGGRSVRWADLGTELAGADLVVSCTGAMGVVIDAAAVRTATATRTGADASAAPYVVIDLALPRDVDPVVADLPGVGLIGLSELAESLTEEEIADDVREVRRIVSSEVAAFLSARNAARVTPTVVALRSMATEVVDAELARFSSRRPDLSDELSADVARTVRRVADKLLHAPTVRMKELAGQPDAITYADALAELFALDPGAVAAVTRVVPPAGEEA